jgi:hypothetical protein
VKRGVIFVEGIGGNPKANERCREYVRTFITNALGYDPGLPVALTGSREEVFKQFCRAHQSGNYRFVAMLVDSETPLGEKATPWAHLASGGDAGNWTCPAGATDEQVLLMVTSMETWLIADPSGLARAFDGIRVKDLPSTALEARTHGDVRRALEQATRECRSP